jgi:hypothetical protein
MNNQAGEKFRFGLRGRTLVMIDWANVHGWFSRPQSKSYLGWKVDPRRLFEYLGTYTEVGDKRLYHGIEYGDKRSENFGVDISATGFTFITKEVKWAPVYLNEEGHFRVVVKKLFDVLDSIKVTNSDISTKLYELRIKVKSWLENQEPDFDVDDLIDKLDIELKKLNINIDDLQKNLLEPVKRRKCDFDVEIARDVCNLSADFDTLILFSGDGDYSALVDDLISKGKKVIVVFARGHMGKEYVALKEQVKKDGLTYRLFICSVENLREEISVETTIPPDFSGGRDVPTLADTGAESQGPLVDTSKERAT